MTTIKESVFTDLSSEGSGEGNDYAYQVGNDYLGEPPKVWEGGGDDSNEGSGHYGGEVVVSKGGHQYYETTKVTKLIDRLLFDGPAQTGLFCS